MAVRERHTAFDTAHPAVGAAFMVVTLALTMCSLEPVLVALSLAGALAFTCARDGVRRALGGLRWQLPFVAIVALVNPLFSASGSTELMRLGSRAVYLESLAFGCAMGALFVASALWFQAAAAIVPEDRVQALVGNVAPTLALMLSQCMRLVPRFVRQGREVLAAGRAMRAPGTRPGDEVRERLRLSTVLMGWTLDDSIQTADAMRARGWGAAPRRTSYVRYRFRRGDAAVLALIAAAALLVGALAARATAGYDFYPVLAAPSSWWGYAPFALWMALPALLDVRERRRFA